MIFDKELKQIHAGKKIAFSTQQILVKLDECRMKINPYLSTCLKLNLKRIKDFHIIPHTEYQEKKISSGIKVSRELSKGETWKVEKYLYSALLVIRDIQSNFTRIG